jgi:hypothetical protein
MMSVTVNDKNARSLALFAADDQRRFRSGKPNVTVVSTRDVRRRRCGTRV